MLRTREKANRQINAGDGKRMMSCWMIRRRTEDGEIPMTGMRESDGAKREGKQSYAGGEKKAGR